MNDRALIVSDLDGTLLGDDEALERFAGWYATVRQHVRLAYNSGRFVESIQRSIETTALPRPDAIIGGVGTVIHVTDTDQRLDDWPILQPNWDAQVIRTALAMHQELEPQPEHLQSEHKISFFGHHLSPAFLQHLKNRLASQGHSAQIVYSSERDLDVLPASADKGTAVAHLAAFWSIDRQQVIVCGDSGNDLAMFQPEFRGVVVANAHQELRELNHPHVYQAAQSHAAGVLEGARYWLNGGSRTTSS